MKKLLPNRNKKHSVRRLILYSYLVFVVLISCIGITAQSVSIRIIEDQTRAVYDYALDRAVAGIDHECQIVRTAANTLFDDAGVNLISSGDSTLSPTDAIARRDLHNKLSNLMSGTLADSYVKNISICFPGRDYVLTDQTALCSDLESWSMDVLHTDMVTARSRFLSGYHTGSFHSLSNPDGSDAGLVYIRTLNFYTTQKSTAILIASIDGISLFQNNLGRFTDDELTQCELVLHDKFYRSDLTYLGAATNPEPADNDMVAKAHSSTMNADFRVSISLNAYVGVMNKATRILLAGTVVFVAFGLLLALVFTQESYRPIRKIFSLLPVGNTAEEDEFARIEGTLRGLLNNVNQLTHELEQNRQEEKERLLLSVIRGNAHISDVSDLLERYGIRLSGDAFVTVVLDGSAPESEYTGNPSLFRYAIQNILTEMVPAGYDSFTCADDSYMVLALCASSELRDRLPSDAARCAVSVMDFFLSRGTRGFVGSVSARHDGPEGIHAAYEESRASLKDPANRQTKLVICGSSRLPVCPDLTKKSYGEMVDATITYIRSIFTDSSVSTGTVAEHFGYNKAYMGQLFKQATGLGISEYIALLRLDKAMHLIASEDLTMGDIVPLCGYYDRQAMSTAFKRYLGMTPSQYRESLPSAKEIAV